MHNALSQVTTRCHNDIRHSVEHFDKHDAMYCKDCNIWLEGKCDDYLCYFCVGRPAKPIDG